MCDTSTQTWTVFAFTADVSAQRCHTIFKQKTRQNPTLQKLQRIECIQLPVMTKQIKSTSQTVGDGPLF